MALTIYKRGRFYWLAGSFKTAAGNKRVHESTGQTDPVLADRVRIKRESDALDALLLGTKAVFTFRNAAARYVAAGKDDRFLAPLVRELGETRISDLNGPLIRDAARKLYPNAAYTTWNRQIITPVRAVVNLNADEGNCFPITVKGFSKRDHDVRLPTTPPKRAVDRSYIDAFREHCEDPRISALVLFLFQTGARIGDALKLDETSGDLDLANRKVIFRDMKNGEDGEADLTIEMVFVLQELAAWKAERAKANDYGKGSRQRRYQNTRVFGFKSRCQIYRVIKATCEKAKIPYLATHQPGRHSFATEMIVRNNIDVATTAALGRWKSKQLLLANYVHTQERRNVIDRVFGMSVEKSGPRADTA